MNQAGGCWFSPSSIAYLIVLFSGGSGLWFMGPLGAGACCGVFGADSGFRVG